MIIGIPKEIKNNEFRVSMTPDGISELHHAGHNVLVETLAGSGSGFSDEDFIHAGASILDKASLFQQAEMIVKVKEPLPGEFEFFKEGQILFTFLHLAANPDVASFLVSKKITALGYETLMVDGKHPLLTPMSEVAGRMAPLVASNYMQKPYGGSGILPPGIPGTLPANALILGAGTVGINAAKICHGLGMHTSVMDINPIALRHLDELYNGHIRTLYSNKGNLISALAEADLIIGAVYTHGSRTPVIVTSEMVRNVMRKGSVVVDVSVDQGGCIETIKPTTHEKPVYEKYGVVHYGVANMPGAFPRTSTIALSNATLPYVKMIADHPSLMEKEPLYSALNVKNGKIILTSLQK